jgi:hypothetical protein
MLTSSALQSTVGSPRYSFQPFIIAHIVITDARQSTLYRSDRLAPALLTPFCHSAILDFVTLSIRHTPTLLIGFMITTWPFRLAASTVLLL